LVSVSAMPTIVAVVMLGLTLTASAQGSPAPGTSLGIASVSNSGRPHARLKRFGRL
jgi:hypothetical protein